MRERESEREKERERERVRDVKLYLLERRSMLLSGREKLESTVQKESDMILALH